MACYHPVHGYESKWLTPNGKRTMVMSVKDSFEARPRVRNCGYCVGCRLEKSRQWAIRCTHEASLYSFNSFLTLTYDNDYLPEYGSLDKKAYPLFMKRLRKRFVGMDAIEYVTPKGVEMRHRPIRYFHCGEYGPKTNRPHYHALVFNFDFPDKVFVGQSKAGYNMYGSYALQELWPFGRAYVASVEFKSSAYVARYCMEKANGDLAYQRYGIFDPYTGELVASRQPEYATMSRRPGIGRLWYDEFKSDVYPGDFVVMNGKKMRPPKYYDGLYEIDNSELFEELKYFRYQKGLRHVKNNTPDRLAVREVCAEKRLKLLIRDLE